MSDFSGFFVSFSSEFCGNNIIVNIASKHGVSVDDLIGRHQRVSKERCFPAYAEFKVQVILVCIPQ